MIAELIDVDISCSISYENAERLQEVTIRLRNAGAFMPTDELQCLIGGLVRVNISGAKSTDVLPGITENPGG